MFFCVSYLHSHARTSPIIFLAFPWCAKLLPSHVHKGLELSLVHYDKPQEMCHQLSAYVSPFDIFSLPFPNYMTVFAHVLWSFIFVFTDMNTSECHAKLLLSHLLESTKLTLQYLHFPCNWKCGINSLVWFPEELLDDINTHIYKHTKALKIWYELLDCYFSLPPFISGLNSVEFYVNLHSHTWIPPNVISCLCVPC